MTKPTGRPKGRPKGPEYTTLMARMPEDLADQAKRYASLHRQTISDVLRDGLLVLLQEEDVCPYFTYDRKEGVSPARAGMLSDEKGAIPSPAFQAPLIASDTQEDAVGQSIITSDTQAALASPGLEPVILSDTKAGTAAENASFASDMNTPSFDPARHHLGGLCIHGHEWGTTGQSLRTNNKAGYCLKCNAEAVASRRQAQRQAKGA